MTVLNILFASILLPFSLLLFQLVENAEGKGSPNQASGENAVYGDVTCPCFCSMRDDKAGLSNYWQSYFEPEKENTNFSRINATVNLKEGSTLLELNAGSFEAADIRTGEWIRVLVDVYWTGQNESCPMPQEDIKCYEGTRQDRFYGAANGLANTDRLLRIEEISSDTIRVNTPWIGEDKSGVKIEKESTCGSTCQNPNNKTIQAAMQFCSQYVDYEFCTKRLSDSEPNGTSFLDRVQQLDNEAFSCAETSNLPAMAVQGEACKDAVRRGACYLAFPKCSDNDMALPICSSHCEHEIRVCRSFGSTFGHLDQIRQTCSNRPFVNIENTTLCTGAASFILYNINTAIMLLFLNFYHSM